MRTPLLLIAAAIAGASPVLAQEAPADPPADIPADTPVADPAPSQDAATMLGDRGKTPDQRADSDGDAPVVQQSDNAGRMEMSTPALAETRSETVVTESSSTSFSVGTPASNDYSRPAGNGGVMAWGGGGGATTVDRMKGSWTLRSGDGRSSCTVKLGDDKWGDLYGAWTPADCPKGFFQVARWGPDGRGLRMADNMGRTVAEFRPSGTDRFEGATMADGQRVVLSR